MWASTKISEEDMIDSQEDMPETERKDENWQEGLQEEGPDQDWAKR
jgi:hypothetical protein